MISSAVKLQTFTSRILALGLMALMLATGVLAYNILLPNLPGSARLDDVRQKTTPELERELAAGGFRLGQPVFMRIFKESNELEVWIRKSGTFQLFKTYPICNYSGALGPKLKEGDKQSPEGFYSVGHNQLNPKSRFHLSFNLGFPNEYDRSHDRTGSFLMVHGKCVSIGCYAMTDRGIEEIYLMAEAALDDGQKFFRVQAFPFRMTDENMQRHAGSQWIDFWRNLKQGYDFFETHRRPPNVSVIGKVYSFEGDT